MAGHQLWARSSPQDTPFLVREPFGDLIVTSARVQNKLMSQGWPNTGFWESQSGRGQPGPVWGGAASEV